jgi:hypothetical protein
VTGAPVRGPCLATQDYAPAVRVIALLATYNEERFIAGCLDHLFRQGVDVFLIDNSSTDDTVAIASRYLGQGLIEIETLPRAGVYSWTPILARKEELAAELDADWFMHLDADEIRLPPRADVTLAMAFAEVSRHGYNAVNFQEFTFVPTLEEPDHDHADFQRTMRWYYPFSPGIPHQLKAWRRRVEPVDLVSTAGHAVRFSGLRMYPAAFPMRHYLFLSRPHAISKYVVRVYDPAELVQGWHRKRAGIWAETIRLPAQADLRRYVSDELLDASHPLTHHPSLGSVSHTAVSA